MAELRRDLGIWGAASIVVGTIIGSGIFLVPKTMVQKVGSVEMVFLVWVAAGLLSLAGALTYAELAAAMSEAGGEYVYLREAYGPFFGFLYGWTQMWVAKSGAIAALEQERDRWRSECEAFQAWLAKLHRARFGRSSEQLDPKQRVFEFCDAPFVVAAQAEALAEERGRPSRFRPR